jgi:hypothetical protein
MTSNVAAGPEVRLATVLRQVLEHFHSGSVVALTPAEQRLAHRLQAAVAAFDVSSSLWTEPVPSRETA